MNRFAFFHKTLGLSAIFFFVVGELGAVATQQSGQQIASPTYNRDIRPILAETCFACHGPDQRKRQADLRLDIREQAIAAGAIDLDDPKNSELLTRIFSEDPEEVMPPPDSRKSLTDSQKENLRAWLELGAKYEVHWSYLPPEPTKQLESNADSPIDYWIDAAIARNHLQVAPRADPATLLRRVYLDLIGLPPTTEQQKSFLNDSDPKAFEKLVDHLLASPYFGERMAIAWLDVVRYADTVGYHGDQNQNVFPYRDWVIDAFNRNLPFDQFTIYQLAGDLIENPTTESRIASSFNRLNMMTREGGAQPKEYLAKYAADRVRTVSGAWLGSTIGCAECHDHKYDPFTMKDFYSLAAYFADLKQWGVYQDYGYTPNPDLRGWSNDHPFPPEIVVDVPYLTRRIEQLRQRRSRRLNEELKRTPPDKQELTRWFESRQAFIKKNPDGWQALKPSSAPENESPQFVPKDNGSFAIQGEKIDSLTIQFADISTSIASISLELLNDEGTEKLFSEGNANIGLSVALIEGPESKPKPVRFEFADADRKLSRYANTFEILGIQGQWRIDSSMPGGTRGVWSLARPLQLASGQSLQITLSGNRCRQIRVSVSPFVPERLWAATEWSQNLKQLIEQKDTTDLSDEFVVRQWALDSTENSELNKIARDADRNIRECRDGKWPVQVSESQTPTVTRILPRGNWQDESGQVVTPSSPSFLPSLSDDHSPQSRLDLANWLVAKENPLTARVQMNRLWKHFFGNGLSPVLDDLGIQGQYPSHPELLDWLAIEFRTSDWNFKHMVKLIVMSEAYQRSSVTHAANKSLDPKNIWLSSQNPRRLEAEIVRDNALAIAGLINLDQGGPPVFPYQPENYYEHLQFPDRHWTSETDDRQFRRGVYMHWQRTFLHPMLTNFDAPSREECTGMRIEANTPLQALTLLNAPTFVEAAKVLASQVILETRDPRERISLMYKRALARQPSSSEIASMAKFVDRQTQQFSIDRDAAKKLDLVGNSIPNQQLDPVELAAWTSVGRAILNLHETITRY